MLLLLISALLFAGGSILVLLRSSARQRQESIRLRDELTHATAAAGEAESRWALWFSANPYPMWIYDCDSLRFLRVNDAAIQAYGYPREEFLNMTLVDIRPEEDAPRFLQSVRQRHDGYNSSGVWRHRRKDGSILFVEIMAFEFERRGRREELILAANVTERRRVEEALRDSEASLKELVEGAPFGIGQSFLEGNRFKTL